jgi:hypothetical protein
MEESIMACKIDDPKGFKKLVGLSLRKEWLRADRESDALLELWNLCDLRQQQDLLYLLLDDYTFINSKDLKEIGHCQGPRYIPTPGAAANPHFSRSEVVRYCRVFGLSFFL